MTQRVTKHKTKQSTYADEKGNSSGTHRRGEAFNSQLIALTNKT